MKYYLEPSILSADFSHLGDDVRACEEAGIERLHVDVMDGAFVPSISFGMPVIKSIRKSTKLFFDVHLMIEAPERYIQDFADCGADLITVHTEACRHLDRTIQQIRAAGVKAGVALNPATPLNVLDHVLSKVDMVLLMTVNPGFGGQSYIPEMTEKIQTLRKLITEKGLNVDIEVDGGVHDATIRTVLDAGANVIVAGSAVFKGEKTKELAAHYQAIVKEYES